jgi:hypothetical protein
LSIFKEPEGSLQSTVVRVLVVMMMMMMMMMMLTRIKEVLLNVQRANRTISLSSVGFHTLRGLQRPTL